MSLSRNGLYTNDEFAPDTTDLSLGRDGATVPLSEEAFEALDEAPDRPDVDPADARMHPAPQQSGLWLPIIITAVVLLGFGVRLLWDWLHPRLPGDHHVMLLADFDNRTGEPAFDVVLKSALDIDLDQSPRLSMVSMSAARETLREVGHSPQDRLTPELAREVCNRRLAQGMFSGSIEKVGNTYAITLIATDCFSGRQLAESQSQASSRGDILPALDRLASNMRGKLREPPQSLQSFGVPIRQTTTSSFDALTAFSKGTRATDGEAVPFYEQAIELDPNFALAYEYMGVAQDNLSNFAAAKTAFAKAYQLHQPVSTDQQFVIAARYYEIVQNDLEAGEKNYVIWAKSYPRDWWIWASLGDTYNQMGRYQDAIQVGVRARSIDQNYVFTNVVLAQAYKNASQFAQAKEFCGKVIARGRDTWDIHNILFQIAVAEHDDAAIAREHVWDKDKSTEGRTLNSAALAEASAGRLQHAEQLFRESRNASAKKQAENFVSTVDAGEAETQRLLGALDQARAMAIKVPLDRDNVSFEAGFNAALSGDTAYARSVVEALSKTATASATVARKVQIPLLNAAIALHEGDAARAVSLLEPAIPFKARDYYVPSLLAEAYLEMHRSNEAAAQYRDILGNPGIGPLSPMYPLAHLGLARSYAMQNNVPASRKEYAAFFSLWKDADAELPVLKQARLENSRLGVEAK